MRPLNGTASHPLTVHSYDALDRLHAAGRPVPCQEFNAGTVNRLMRGGLATISMIESPYRTRPGHVSALVLTDLGRAEREAYHRKNATSV